MNQNWNSLNLSEHESGLRDRVLDVADNDCALRKGTLNFQGYVLDLVSFIDDAWLQI